MTTVVVGAARGIGEAVARRLATEPWAGKVVLADLLFDETPRSRATCAEAGREVEAIAVDLRDDASIASLVERTREADKVALVAGIFKPVPSLEITRDEFERILSVNTFGTFMVAQAYAREMVERGEGSIVAIGSIAARMPRMRQAAYCASKAAMRQALRVLALETVPRGVRINFVAPGPGRHRDDARPPAGPLDGRPVAWQPGRVPAADPRPACGPARGRGGRGRVPPLPGRQPRVVPRPVRRRRREPRAVTERPALAGITPILATPYRDDGRIALDDIERQVDHLAGLGGHGDRHRVRKRHPATHRLRARWARADGRRRRRRATAGPRQRGRELASSRARPGRGHARCRRRHPDGHAARRIELADPAALADYYATIATEIGLPIVVQDAPGLTGPPCQPHSSRGSPRHRGITAIKIETMPPAPKVGDVVALPHGGAAILGGAGGIDFYHELERGADGTVPGVAMAELFVAVVARTRRAIERELAACSTGICHSWRSRPAAVTRFFAVQLEILARRGIVTRTAIRPPSDVDPRLAGEVGVLLDDLGIGGGPGDPESEAVDGD